MPLGIGDVAPPIVGTDVVNNKPWSLAEQANKTVLLAFSGMTWCGPCALEAPALEAVWQQLSGNTLPPFTMALISGRFEGEEEDPQALQSAIANFGITFPVVPGASYFEAYDVHGVPRLFCLRWNGEAGRHEVCAIHHGATGTAEEIKQGILGFLYGCGVTETHAPSVEHWAATFLLLFGGAGSDGGGIGITPGGQPVPIPPWDPMRHLGQAGRDALTGLAVAELAGQLRDPERRDQVRRAGIRAARVSVGRLDELRVAAPSRVTSGGATWGPDMSPGSPTKG